MGEELYGTTNAGAGNAVQLSGLQRYFRSGMPEMSQKLLYDTRSEAREKVYLRILYPGRSRTGEFSEEIQTHCLYSLRPHLAFWSDTPHVGPECTGDCFFYRRFFQHGGGCQDRATAAPFTNVRDKGKKLPATVRSGQLFALLSLTFVKGAAAARSWQRPPC